MRKSEQANYSSVSTKKNYKISANADFDITRSLVPGMTWRWGLCSRTAVCSTACSDKQHEENINLCSTGPLWGECLWWLVDSPHKGHSIGCELGWGWVMGGALVHRSLITHFYLQDQSVGMCVFVCHHNLSPVQTRIAKFGTEVQNTLVKISTLLFKVLINWLTLTYNAKCNLKVKIHPFWVCPSDNSPSIQVGVSKFW